MRRAISQRFFIKLKPIFDVANKEELVIKVDDIEKNKRDNLERYNYNIPVIHTGLNITELCKLK